MACRFTCAGIERNAFIRDLSFRGAFLYSDFAPPDSANVRIRIETSLLQAPLILEGTIARRDGKRTQRAQAGAFTVRFHHVPVELLRLISSLAARGFPKIVSRGLP